MVLIYLLVFIYGVFGADLDINPCKLTDKICMENSANTVLEKVIKGISSLGIESSDPLFVENAEGNLSVLKFKFTNTNITGFSTCKLSNIKLNLEASTLKFDLTCKRFEHNGHYEINGRLIILPVEGSGDYNLVSGQYFIQVSAEVKTVKGEGGKSHLQIKNFDLNLKAEEPIVFKFENLFNGQKDLSDAIHKFANENWKEVSELVQGPVISPDLKIIFSRVNKYLKTVPIEDLILN